MRTTLIDWLLQVHLRYHMLPETLWIAINVIDRFLSNRVVSLIKFQLVGVTAMFVAAKYEEIMAPSVEEFVFMTEGGYSREEILKGERIILQSLEFNISSYCTPYSWVRRISKADDYDIQTRTLSKFLMEVTLLDHRFLRAKPSMIAAVGMYLSRRMLGGDWVRPSLFFASSLSLVVPDPDPSSPSRAERGLHLLLAVHRGAAPRPGRLPPREPVAARLRGALRLQEVLGQECVPLVLVLRAAHSSTRTDSRSFSRRVPQGVHLCAQLGPPELGDRGRLIRSTTSPPLFRPRPLDLAYFFALRTYPHTRAVFCSYRPLPPPSSASRSLCARAAPPLSSFHRIPFLPYPLPLALLLARRFALALWPSSRADDSWPRSNVRAPLPCLSSLLAPLLLLS